LSSLRLGGQDAPEATGLQYSGLTSSGLKVFTGTLQLQAN